MKTNKLLAELLLIPVRQICICACALGILAGMALWCGCKNDVGLSNNHRQPENDPDFMLKAKPVAPTEFIKKIRHTDHIIITNRYADWQKAYQGFSLTLSGDKMKRIVKAISLLKVNPYSPGSASGWEWQLQFYQGTNCLGIANFDGMAIVIDREYPDETGVLEELYDELTELTRSRVEKMHGR